MPDVRTTFQPGEVRRVSQTEFTDLDRQGLILEVVTGDYLKPPTKTNVTVHTVGTSSAAPVPKTASAPRPTSPTQGK